MFFSFENILIIIKILFSVVESILKGEEVGITPRRRACNQNQFVSLLFLLLQFLLLQFLI